MSDLPPLKCLRFFDSAARHQNFVRAAEELGVTAPAVAHRVRTLEAHVRAPLFDRHAQGVGLNSRENKYHKDVQRTVREIRRCTVQCRADRPGANPDHVGG